MKRFILSLLAVVVLSVSVFGIAASPQPAYASAKDQVCSGVGGCDESPTQITSTVRNIVNLLSAIIGVVSVVVIVIAGFKYVTSAGDSSKIASAKNTLIYAIVGLIIVAMSQAIVRFVLQRAT